MYNRKPKTLKQALLVPVTFCAGFALTALFMMFVLGYGTDFDVEAKFQGHGTEAMDIRPPAPHSPDAVAKKHPIDGNTCWNGDAPKDVDYPGHVIWQKPNGYTVYSAKPVDPALNTIFGKGHLAGTPIVFCR